MKNSFAQSMDWLHTWGGLFFGWLLFAIFLTGTLTVFDKELTYCMQPELHRLQPSLLNIEAAAQQLARFGDDAEHWWIELPNARTSEVRIFWQHQGTFEERRLDPVTGDLWRVRETFDGDFSIDFTINCI